MDGNQNAAGAMVQAGYLTQAMSANALAGILLSPAIPGSCSTLMNIAYGATVSGGANLVQQNALIHVRMQDEFDPLQLVFAMGSGAISRVGTGNSCFAGETQVRTRRGFVRFDELVVGDEVLSAPDDDPQAVPEFRQVEEIFQTIAHIWHLHVKGQIVRTTPGHEFYAWGKGWVPACELQPGDLLRSEDNRFAAVEDICDGGYEEGVYNCRVESFHTYFVGGEDWGFSVWAHNSCTPARQLAKNKKNGKLAEIFAEAFYRGIEGIQVIGTNFFVNTTEGRRFIDILVRVNGKLVAIEVKSGNAVRSASQIARDVAMARDGVMIGTAREFIQTVVRRF